MRPAARARPRSPFLLSLRSLRSLRFNRPGRLLTAGHGSVERIYKTMTKASTRTAKLAPMKTFIVSLLPALLLSLAQLSPAADTLSETLQKGLFEEEANHNLEGA